MYLIHTHIPNIHIIFSMALIIILEIIIAVVCIAATVTGLRLCWKNDQLPTLYKWGWTFVFLCFTFIGLIVYLIIYPPKKPDQK